MSTQRDSMMDPTIETLLERVDSKFTLVTLASMRGRQINLYFNQLGEGLGAIVPPQVTSTSRKPLSIALEEIAGDKITYTRLFQEEGAEEGAEDAMAEAAKNVSEVIVEAASDVEEASIDDDNASA